MASFSVIERPLAQQMLLYKAHLSTQKHANDSHFKAQFRDPRTWAIAVGRGSYKSLFLLNSGRFSLEK